MLPLPAPLLGFDALASLVVREGREGRQVTDLAFPLTEYTERIGRVREAMSRHSLDGLLIHSLPEICYLTGFQTALIRAYACLIIPAQGECALVIERDEQYNAHESSWVNEVFTYPRWIDPVDTTLEAISSLGLSGCRMGLDLRTRYLAPLDYLKIADRLKRLSNSHGIVSQCMRIKSQLEVDYIRRAASITELGMRAAIDAAVIGTTDNAVASTAYKVMIGSGSEYMSSDPIVCAGNNSFVPHGHFRNRNITDGDLVLLEMSGCVRRYSAPMMRTVSIGQPGKVVAAMADRCPGALEAIIERMRPGALFSDLASAGKAVLADFGTSMIFHGTYAYSVGLGFPGTSWADSLVEIREGVLDSLAPGMVFHIPMSLRDRGKAGVACSDSVLITASGCESLTHMERGIFIR
jgi:Xaa-Pro dipeptidase